jgi:hypothetical protein
LRSSAHPSSSWSTTPSYAVEYLPENAELGAAGSTDSATRRAAATGARPLRRSTSPFWGRSAFRDDRSRREAPPRIDRGGGRGATNDSAGGAPPRAAKRGVSGYSLKGEVESPRFFAGEGWRRDEKAVARWTGLGRGARGSRPSGTHGLRSPRFLHARVPARTVSRHCPCPSLRARGGGAASRAKAEPTIAGLESGSPKASR